jgi:hypothetical protein
MDIYGCYGKCEKLWLGYGFPDVEEGIARVVGLYNGLAIWLLVE